MIESKKLSNKKHQIKFEPTTPRISTNPYDKSYEAR